VWVCWVRVAMETASLHVRNIPEDSHIHLYSQVQFERNVLWSKHFARYSNAVIMSESPNKWISALVRKVALHWRKVSRSNAHAWVFYSRKLSAYATNIYTLLQRMIFLSGSGAHVVKLACSQLLSGYKCFCKRF
jgi:hypothetical protein